MKDLSETVKDIERDLVINLTISLRHKKISKYEARNIAREFMKNYPFENNKDLFEKLYELSSRYWVIRKVYIKYVLNFEDEQSKKILTNMRNFMKINDYEKAIFIAKAGE